MKKLTLGDDTGVILPIPNRRMRRPQPQSTPTPKAIFWLLRMLICLFLLSASGFAENALAKDEWRDACTGKEVPTYDGPYMLKNTHVSTLTGAQIQPFYYPMQIDPTDPNRAFVSQTGQNLVLDASGSWHDAATGKEVPTYDGPYMLKNTHVSTLTGAQIQPFYYPMQIDPTDPNRAFVSATSQNLVRAKTPPTEHVGMVIGPKPGVGFCQNLTPIIGGDRGTGHLAPIREVIQNPTDYANFFAGAPPATPVIDFTKQDVLAVDMGNQPTGGYSININHVEVRTSGFTAGDGFVYVDQYQPVPGVTYSTKPTQPFQVVALPKGAATYHFVEEPLATDFQQIVINIQNHSNHSDSTLTLNANGAVTYEPFNGPMFTAQATQAELQAVDVAVNAANFWTLPTTIPDTRSPPGILDYSVEIDAGRKTFHLSGATDFFGSYPQVKPVVDSLQMIAERISLDSSLWIGVTLRSGGGIAFYRQDITVDHLGSVSVSRTGSGVQDSSNTYFAGIATPKQLRDLSDAVSNLNPSTLPATVTDPSAGMSIRSSESIQVTVVGGVTYTVLVPQAGFYGSFVNQLKPMVDAMHQAGEPAVYAATSAPITGLVTATSLSPLAGLTVGGLPIDTSDPFANLLASFNGQNATIEANNTGAVIGVQGTINVTESPLAFPNLIGAASFGSLPAGTTVLVRDMSLPLTTNGSFYEVTTADGLQGYAEADIVTFGTAVTPPLNNFSIAAPVSISILSGSSATATVSSSITSGSALPVALTVTGLTNGITASFNPASIFAGSSSQLTLTADSTVAAGSYTATVTGTSGTIVQKAPVAVIVTFPSPPVANDFSFSISPVPLSVVRGGSTTATISTSVISGIAQPVTFSVAGKPPGLTATVSPATVTAGSSAVLSVSSGLTTPVGAFTLSVTATEGTTSHAMPVVLSVQ